MATVRCECGASFRIRDELAGRKLKCPKCQRPIFLPEASPPDLLSLARAADPLLGQPLVAPGTPENAVPPGARPKKTAASGRWNFLASAAWLLLGWSLAGAATWFTVWFPAWLEAVLNVLPLLVTAALIAWNLVASVRILGHTGRSISALPLTAWQVVLFTLLFYQIACHRGAHHYALDRVPGFIDWVWLAVVHAVRASDLLDAIQAYGWHVQTIHNSSHLTAWSLVLYHAVINLFVLRLIMEGLERWKQRLAGNEGLKTALRVAAIAACALFLAAWLASALYFRPWRMLDLVLWPLDNLLRVLDFLDVMEIYQLRLHRVPTLAWEATLTLVCRVLMAVALADVLNRVWQTASMSWWQGRGLSQGELERLAREHPDKTVKKRASELAATLARRRRQAGRVQWPTAIELLTTVGAAWMAALLLFLVGGRDAGPTLAAAVAADDEAGARRACRALQRAGPRLQQAAALFETSLPAMPAAKQVQVLETLGYLGPTAAKPLAVWLENDDPAARLAATTALGRIGLPAIDVWLPALVSGRDDVREAASGAISALGTAAVQPLIDAITPENAGASLAILERIDPYWHMRQSANPEFGKLAGMRGASQRLREAQSIEELNLAAKDLIASGPAGRQLAISIVRERAKSNPPELRDLVIILAAEKEPVPEFAPELLGLLADPDNVVRNTAAAALARIGTPVVAPLIELFKDPRGDVQSAALYALERMGEAPLPMLADRLSAADDQSRNLIASVMRNSPVQALPLLVQHLAHPDPRFQGMLLTLFREGGDQSIEILTMLPADADAATKANASTILALLGGGVLPVLERRLSDPHEHVRTHAAQTLKAMGNFAVLPLTKRLIDPDPEVRKVVAKTLIEMGPASFETAGVLLLHAAGRRPGPVQLDNPEQITQFFVGLSDSDESVRTATSLLIAQMGATAQHLLQEWRAAGSPVVKPTSPPP